MDGKVVVPRNWAGTRAKLRALEAEENEKALLAVVAILTEFRDKGYRLDNLPSTVEREVLMREVPTTVKPPSSDSFTRAEFLRNRGY